MIENSLVVDKSTRHSKIIGDLGERLIANWLSRSKFEVTIVDHTGIDIVAYDPKRKKRLGITVKSRTRNKGKENITLALLRYGKAEDDRKRVIDACEAFACEPWIGMYVETRNYADLYLVSLEHYDSKYRGSKKRTIDYWQMTEKWKTTYDKDMDVFHLRIKFKPTNWFT